jgi:hypothetical protein
MARHDADGQTVIFVLDDQTADAAIHGTTTLWKAKPTLVKSASKSQSLPEGSYGRRNREAIIARETHLAAGLRAIERSFRATAEADAMPASELSQLLCSPARSHGRGLELELDDVKRPARRHSCTASE